MAADSMHRTRMGLVNFLINLADIAPDTRFGKLTRFEYYGNDSYLAEFASGTFATQTFMGDIFVESSYEAARQHVPSMVIPIHYPGDIPDD